MATRYNINDFALANPAYAGGTVSFYTVSGGAKTTTLATLYAASTGSTTLANPRTLDSDGKFSVPVYVEVPTVATVSGLTVADHDTGIMGLAEGAASTSATAAAVSAAAALASQTAAAASAAAASAAITGIGQRSATTVGGTVDAITATFTPAFASLAASAGIVLAIPLAGANTSTTPTLAIDGFTAKTIVTGSGSAMVAGAIPGGDFVGLFVYDASADKFQMLNPSGGVTTGDIFMSGAMIVEAEGAAVASAASCNIWATDGNTCHITGTTQIDDFATAPQAGAWKKVVFDDALILNQSANLNLNGGGADITTAAGDMAFVYADTTTQMDVFVIRKSGREVAPPTPVISTPYDSGDLTIALAGAHTLTHSLGGVPKVVMLLAKCIDGGGDAGYAQNEVIVLATNGSDAAGSNYGVSMKLTATQIILRVGGGSANSFTNYLHATTGAINGLDYTKWALIVRAYA